MSALLIKQRDGVRLLINNNPTVRNALSPELSTQLPAALAQAQEDAQVGAIVLTGAEGYFCAGGDLRQLATRRELSPPDRLRMLDRLHGMINAIRDCHKPVIAAVEGGCAGAGFSLALACDLLVTSPEAAFSMAYVKVGLSPDGGATAFLSQFVSRQILTELCLSGERLSGERLHALGAVNRLVAADQVQETAQTLAAQLAQGPSRTMGRIKQLCQSAYGNDVATQMALEAEQMVAAQGDAEAAEGISAFLQKRHADFTALRTTSI